jgi:predicted O-linked N-acetylglucosamine transferase (SPINDLY family)
MRRIRIGYVSADLRDHSAAVAFGCMLTRYDRSQFDVFAYSNFKEKDDDKFAKLFKQNVTVWRNILGLSDDSVAKIIRDDQIDILVDLSGHSAGNRLLVFARKPAPIQITAWGYASSTGMRAMDVFFTDPVMITPKEKQFFTEEIRYLPCMMGALFIENFPDVNELPSLSTGIITFGCFNRLQKVSDNTFQVWAKLLLAVPLSRLVLKTVELSNASIRDRIINHFTKAGVSADRIILLGKTSWHEHMQTYNQIDISLDPFPQTGGVTTLESLMMGVPVITLYCPTLIGRASTSILTTIGLPDWIAETTEQYIEIACHKAKDLIQLTALRQRLRPLLSSSMIGDVDAYTRAVEHEYRQLWQRWCASSGTPGPEQDQKLLDMLAAGHLQKAEKLAQNLTERYPLYGFGWKILGAILKATKRFDEALEPLQKAAALLPDDVEAHYNLGLLFLDLTRNEEAFACFRRVSQFNHEQPDIHNKIGDYHLIHGRLDEAVKSYRRAQEIKPNAGGHSNLIFTLDLMDGLDGGSMLEERKKWNVAHAAQVHPQQAHSNIPDPERRIRIGYVSADFSSASAPSVFNAMLFAFDRSRFDVIAYSNDQNAANVHNKKSAVTERIQQNVTSWKNIYEKSDDAVAKLIQQDKIDILIDLSGHSQSNRLLVFARKPAPIQITAWGYATGTGMPTMDVLFSDPIMIPSSDKQFYVEQVRCLPSYLSYTPPFNAPTVNALPALSSDMITFGCFSRGSRITDETFQLWAQILRLIPHSRMLFKPGEASYLSVKERLTAYFTSAGIDLERIRLLETSSWEIHMVAHNQIDIALDPFPQCGGITTLECLMMGVPVITLRGSTFVGRTGASFLTTMNLTDWIAETPEQYIEIAIRKSQDISILADLRQQLRTRLTTSVICDAKTYVQAVEQEYLQLWREWCDRNKSKN